MVFASRFDQAADGRTSAAAIIIVAIGFGTAAQFSKCPWTIWDAASERHRSLIG